MVDDWDVVDQASERRRVSHRQNYSEEANAEPKDRKRSLPPFRNADRCQKQWQQANISSQLRKIFRAVIGKRTGFL